MPTTITRRAALASSLGALAVAAAGCGAGGSQSAGGTVSTSRGGVAGAQANVGSAQLRARATGIQQTLNRALARLSRADSRRELSQAADTTRRQVLQAANRLDRLHVSSPRAQQLQGQLQSALRSLAADVTTLEADAESGDTAQALADLKQLSSLTAVRDALRQIRTAGSG